MHIYVQEQEYKIYEDMHCFIAYKALFFRQT